MGCEPREVPLPRAMESALPPIHPHKIPSFHQTSRCRIVLLPMDLSPEERQRIYLEEKACLEAQTALRHAQNADLIRLAFGCLVAAVIVGAVVAGVNFLLR